MSDSILDTVKESCNIVESSTEFDAVLIMNINAAIATLWQLGTFSGDLHMITGDSETWDQITDDETLLPLVISYVCNKTRLMFDPPTSSALKDILENIVDEQSFRINAVTDPTEEEYNSVIVEYFESKALKDYN